MKKLFFLLSILISAPTLFFSNAQDKMYLVKGNHVVGKFNVDDVDYISFDLPSDVREDKIWLSVDEIGKNTVTYTVNAIDANTAYAHNLLDYYTLTYTALSYFDNMFEDLADDEKLAVMRFCLQNNAYVGAGTQSYTQVDFDNDGSSQSWISRFSVVPGRKYWLCAWQVDAQSMEPMEEFSYIELQTLEPEASPAKWDVTFKRQNEEGLAFDFTSDADVKYFNVTYGVKRNMELFFDFYGKEFAVGMYGQNFTPEELTGEGSFKEGIENATWPIDGGGEYLMVVRAYDYDGNMTEKTIVATAQGPDINAPQINVFSRSKENGSVAMNFEITPSNVKEAFVNIMPENDIDDAINEGASLYDLAKGEGATDITSEINTYGESTFRASVNDQKWHCIIICAQNKEGGKIAQRFAFNMIEDSSWEDYNPVYSSPARRLPVLRSFSPKGSPTIKRICRKE